MMHDVDPTSAGQTAFLVCVSLGRCVVGRSVDGGPLSVAYVEGRTKNSVVMPVVACTYSKLH